MYIIHKYAHTCTLYTNLCIQCTMYLFTLGLIWKSHSHQPSYKDRGFRVCGIYPVNRHAIPDSKLTTSVPYAGHRTQAAEADSAQDTTTATATATTCTVLDLKCNDCGCCLTPVRMYIVAYFTKHLQKDRCSATKERQPLPQTKILWGGIDERGNYRGWKKKRRSKRERGEGQRTLQRVVQAPMNTERVMVCIR